LKEEVADLMSFNNLEFDENAFYQLAKATAENSEILYFGKKLVSILI